MESIISLVIAIIVFCIVAYGLKWVCTNFSLPQPILWVCGALLLIILLLFCAHYLGIYSGFPTVSPVLHYAPR